ncbi:MAG TPA: hypothetical protein VJT49_00230 [Amycolatopsis sp.]|nr:hypothetical protein [Amycolatopsis sp.]HKS43541.1 hypothetical protein [Amycolatopsis sp.]
MVLDGCFPLVVRATSPGPPGGTESEQQRLAGMCTRDNAIRPAPQQKFISEADAAFPDNPTSVVALDASHSPFLSMPHQVADIVAKLG